MNRNNQKKAILAEAYYRDEKKELSIIEICKLCDIKSKATLYRYLMFQGRRNCTICNAYFWDKNQDADNAYCEKHIKKKK